MGIKQKYNSAEMPILTANWLKPDRKSNDLSSGFVTCLEKQQVVTPRTADAIVTRIKE